MKGTHSPVNRLLIVLLITLSGLTAIPVGALAQTQDAVIAVLDAVPALSALAINAESDGIEIRSVTVSGLSHLDENIVIAGLTIKAGDILVGNATAKLNDAAESLYNTGWFRSRPELSLDTAPGAEESGGGSAGAVLNVAVQENPLYRATRLSGNSLFSTERLLREIEGQPGADGTLAGARCVKGKVINVKQLMSGLDGIINTYTDSGYIGAQIADYSFLISGPEEGTVEVRLTEGLVDEVIIAGLQDTRESVVRSQITHLRPGTVLERSKLERDLNQIYNTGLFESVTPDLQPSLKEGYVKIVLQVTEAHTGQAGVGLGYSTVNGLQGSLEYRESNLFGRGKQIGATLMFSRNKPGFEITYSDPFAGGRSFWNVGIFNMHSRQQRNPGTPYESELAVDTQGASFGYGQKVTDLDSWQATFGIVDYDYSIKKGDPFRGYSPANRARLSARGETRKLGLTYAHDTRDNIFSTTQGYLAKATGELAGFGGDFSFNKWTFEGREFFKLGPGSLGFRQRLGTATGDVPIYEEYRIGGVNSVRGISEDQLTGTHSFLSNIEYRLPLNETFGLVGFYDAGWAGESFSGMDSASGAGIGARIRIPALGIGAVRLDYAWELSGQENAGNNGKFHFFLGEMF